MSIFFVKEKAFVLKEKHFENLRRSPLLPYYGGAAAPPSKIHSGKPWIFNRGFHLTHSALIICRSFLTQHTQ